MAEECVVAHAHELTSLLFGATLNVTSYNTWLLNKDDHGHVMKWHRRLLQFLQARSEGDDRGWVVKTPW